MWIANDGCNWMDQTIIDEMKLGRRRRRRSRILINNQRDSKYIVR